MGPSVHGDSQAKKMASSNQEAHGNAHEQQPTRCTFPSGAILHLSDPIGLTSGLPTLYHNITAYGFGPIPWSTAEMAVAVGQKRRRWRTPQRAGAFRSLSLYPPTRQMPAEWLWLLSSNGMHWETMSMKASGAMSWCEGWLARESEPGGSAPWRAITVSHHLNDLLEGHLQLE